MAGRFGVVSCYTQAHSRAPRSRYDSTTLEQMFMNGGKPMATILCIDDEPSILEIQRALLESKGYKVLTAPDGATGIALARKHSIGAVLLDFSMPGMNGNQVAQVLMKEQPTLPVVVWSGCLDEVPESLWWFADAVLHKGDGLDTLL